MPEIIVGVDGSARGEDAMAFAQQLARTTGAALTLASAFAYDEWPSRAASNDYREFLRQDTRAMLDRMRAKLDDPEVPVHAIADPTPARALHLLADQDGAALLVVGSSHRGHVGRVLLGSTADRLLHGAPCPVAVVPHGYPAQAPIQTIGVGYDGSVEGDAALTGACQVARRFGAGLRVIRVFDASTVGTPALISGPGYVAAWKEMERLARENLESRVASLPDDVAAEAVFRSGSPGRELSAQTEGVDLMLLGSRGYGPLRSVLLGGVAQAVLREAMCPVIVMPRGARHGVDELFAAASEASA